jgi:hypothetical protein
MTRTDPYTPSGSHYECLSCGERIASEKCGCCPECSGEVKNIAIPRE